eukprot:Plantae.Rhodophyta-Purpureofilum_apyrenoidigerum.ctg6989.p1 GENE.Plantae.Rhodophyta-Purpureofilum_apyrenoidigerum.ctg6989~~Plantae.Rhodophyta-Purpureofilum_apyrenoidigerum.ctg6989.p1  ORF type:complete len:266 (+),score=56.99 Plantae.Rhodophyta-Purpureofilum_apyrenoidigerum.ctg6989:342-1139(+)
MSFAAMKSEMLGGEKDSAVLKLTGCITTMHTNNQILRRMLKSSPDSRARESAEEVRARNDSLAKEGMKMIEGLSNGQNQSTRAQVTMNKLSRDLKDVTTEYRNIVSAWSSWNCGSTPLSPEQNKQVLSPFRGPTETTTLLSPPGKQNQFQLLLQEEEGAKKSAEEQAMESNEQFMFQRQEAMSHVHQQLQDVNAIFKDLAVVIGDQGEQIEYIENATAEAKDDVTKGKREIKKRDARLHSRRKFFYMALLIMAFAIALFLLVMLS